MVRVDCVASETALSRPDCEEATSLSSVRSATWASNTGTFCSAAQGTHEGHPMTPT